MKTTNSTTTTTTTTSPSTSNSTQTSGANNRSNSTIAKLGNSIYPMDTTNEIPGISEQEAKKILIDEILKISKNPSETKETLTIKPYKELKENLVTLKSFNNPT